MIADVLQHHWQEQTTDHHVMLGLRASTGISITIYSKAGNIVSNVFVYNSGVVSTHMLGDDNHFHVHLFDLADPISWQQLDDAILKILQTRPATLGYR